MSDSELLVIAGLTLRVGALATLTVMPFAIGAAWVARRLSGVWRPARRRRIDLNDDGQANLADANLFGRLWVGVPGLRGWQGQSLPPKPE